MSMILSLSFFFGLRCRCKPSAIGALSVAVLVFCLECCSVCDATPLRNKAWRLGYNEAEVVAVIVELETLFLLVVYQSGEGK